MGDVSWLLPAMEYLPFLQYVKFVDIGKSITNFRTAGNVMPYHFFSNGSAGGCFLAYAAFWRHKAFNLHYFRHYHFSKKFSKHLLSHFPNKAQKNHYG